MDTSHVWLLSCRVMVPCPISLLQHFSVHPNAISAGREGVGTGAKLREISLWTELESTWKAPSHMDDEDYETLEKDCNEMTQFLSTSYSILVSSSFYFSIEVKGIRMGGKRL